MKNLHFWSLILVFIVSINASAQRNPSYRVWVTLMDRTEIKGTLYQVHPQELVVQKVDLTQVRITSAQIKNLKLRRNGNVGRGAWMGAAGGAVAGGLLGIASGDDPPGFLSWSAEEKAATGVILGAPVGALMGIGIGSAKTTYTINGDRNQYQHYLPVLKTYLPEL